jgi:Predicted membrane protein
MKYDDRKIAGSLLFIGAVLCVLGIIVAEALYPDYSTSENYISDLGVGPSSLIFNSSLFLLGVLTVVGAYFIQRAFDFRLFSIFAAITGIGAMGLDCLQRMLGLYTSSFPS